MGHSSTAITLDTYGHLWPADARTREAVQRALGTAANPVRTPTRSCGHPTRPGRQRRLPTALARQPLTVPISPDDRAGITELLALHGHLFDDGELDRLDLLFTASISYDVTAFGGGVLHGMEEIRAATLALGDRNPVGHHVTNVVLAEQPDGSVRARSKGIGVYADGTAGSVTYEDTVVRTGEGWRIDSRTVAPRRTPLGGAE